MIGINNLNSVNNQIIRSPQKEAKNNTQSITSFEGNYAPISPDNYKAMFLSKPSKNVSFGRALVDHASWGANVTSDGKVTFKVWAPYADSIKLLVRDQNGPAPITDHTEEEIKEILKNNSHCGEWEYKQDDVRANKWNYLFGKPEKSKTVEMKQTQPGVFEISMEGVKAGDMYKFVLQKGSREVNVKDPRSKSQPNDINGWSQVVNEQAYQWKNNESWKNHPNKLRNTESFSNLTPPSKMVIDEIHIGTFTKEGTYEAAMKKLEQVAADGIYNTVELMPVNEFYGSRNWGYEGTDLYAPESAYGSPEKLKQLVDKAHELGLNVLLDVVYNHLGPFNNVVGEFGQYFDQNKGTPWGGGINYEYGSHAQNVRQYVVDNTLHWLKDYNFDGLRLDMTRFMQSDVVLKEIAFEVRKHKPEAILTAEDSRNSKRLVLPLESKDIKSDKEGEKFDIGSIMTSNGVNSQKLRNLGFDGQWNFDFQHTLEALSTGRSVMDFGPSVNDLATEMYNNYKNYEACDHNLQIPEGHTNVNYVMSHDEAGNRGGTRLISKIIESKLGISPNKAIELVEAYVNNDDAKFNTSEITKERFGKALEEAKAQNKVATAAVFVSPGSKMLLMGDEEGELAPFKFFSQYPVKGLEEKIGGPGDKNYSIGVESFNDAKIGGQNHTDSKMKEFTKDLAKIFYDNPALNNGKRTQMKLQSNEKDKILAMHRWDGLNEVFTVMNFGQNEFKNNYQIDFPQGKWELILNSDDNKYGGSNSTDPAKTIDGSAQVDVLSIPKNSVLLYKKVG